MIVIEVSESKYGQAMKDITCMETKLDNLKHLLEQEASGVSYRSKKYMEEDYPREYDRDRDYSMDRKFYGGRYM